MANSKVIWSWIEALNVATGAIISNRLRSVLTIIGIVIGVAVVSIVASLLEGAQRYISQEAEALGPGVVEVEKASFLDFIGDADAFAVAQARRPDLTIDDLKAVRERLGDRMIVGAQVQASLPVSRGARTLKGIGITGVTPDISTLTAVKLESGRELTAYDDAYRSAVCVVGADVAEELFTNDDPIGKTIKIGMAEYEVVGVYAKRGSSFGASQDAFVQIALNTFARIFGTRSRSITILAKAGPGMTMSTDDVEDLLRFNLRQVRRVEPAKEDNFSIRTARSIQRFAGNITALVGAVLYPLTGISLVVGGIVVMNMMLASVTERTREIGIRMSLGARRRDILAQFLIESTLLTVVGGLIGAFVAFLAIRGGAMMTGFPIRLPAWALVSAIGVSCAVGLTFGVFPARRAARLDPIEALRTE